MNGPATPGSSRSLRLALLFPGLVGLAGGLAGACSVVHVEAEERYSGLDVDGLVDGHVALGVPAETSLLDADLFSGRSPGAVAELSVWKLLRLELGLAGATVGVGPLDLGLGVGFYEPRSWLKRRSAPEGGGDAPARSPAPPARPTEVDAAEALAPRARPPVQADVR